MNRLVLSAQLVERGALRYTPAGLPVCEISLRHESQLVEAAQRRSICFEIKAVGIGEIALRLERQEIGAPALFTGFLSHQRNGRGTVFHVTEVGRAPEPGHESESGLI